MKISTYKQLGETPLEALDRIRVEKEIPINVPMTYAGRLDPMAEGLLLILVGEECKNKDNYLGLDKEYEVEVLFGFETDTGDTLGKVKGQKSEVKTEIKKSKVEEILKTFIGKSVQEYPAYSSKTVNGVQLHTLANKGELPDKMPTKEVEIYDIQIIEERKIEADVLLEEIKNKISKVNGNFRQSEIVNLWEQNLQGLDPYKIVKIRVACSSGTYMRSLAHNLGQRLGTCALAYSIKRVTLGSYHLA